MVGLTYLIDPEQKPKASEIVDGQFIKTDIKEGVEPTDAEQAKTAMYDNMAMEGACNGQPN